MSNISDMDKRRAEGWRSPAWLRKGGPERRFFYADGRSRGRGKSCNSPPCVVW